MERDILISAPSELNFFHDAVMNVVRPLYGIPEPGLHWYLTYLEDHVGRLGMKRRKVDPCVLIRQDNGKISGVVILKVEDIL